MTDTTQQAAPKAHIVLRTVDVRIICELPKLLVELAGLGRHSAKAWNRLYESYVEWCRRHNSEAMPLRAERVTEQLCSNCHKPWETTDSAVPTCLHCGAEVEG